VIGAAREIGERVGIRLDTANKLCQSVSNPADEIAEVFLDEVPGMVKAFGNDAKRSNPLPSTTQHGVSPPQFGTIHFEEPCSKLQRMFCLAAVLRADRKEVCCS
jgi:hypothetical protein